MSSGDVVTVGALRIGRCGAAPYPSVLAAVKLLEVLVQDPVLQLLADGLPGDLVVLAPEVTPRLVRGEEDAIRAHAPPLDLGQQPANPESDRPGGVGVDAVSLLDPVQEPGHQPDISAYPAAEMDEVGLHVLGVTLDQGYEVSQV